MEKIESTLFYTIEKAIKSYRQFAQKELKKAGLKITVDQWLTIKCISDHPQISQKELAAIVFKDEASITRIIGLLVKAGYVKRGLSADDGRRQRLLITPRGKRIISEALKVVNNYRKKALEGTSAREVRFAQSLLNSIINNCSVTK